MPGKQKHPQTSRLLLSLIAILFLLLSTSGCGLDISFYENLSDIYSLSTNIDQDIEFIAELSIPLNDDDSLALDLVDEIKGIPNNITRFNMTKMDDLHYHVIISIMDGSNVSYRYTKIGTITQNEITIAGNAVRYRLFHAGETTQVKDIISGWTENDYSGLVGDLHGTIVEKGSGDPIADVLVCIAGYQTFTNSLGKFSILNIPDGIHNFVVYSIDGSYKVFQQNMQIKNDLDTTVAIELTKLKEVIVKFIVNTPPNNEVVPIRIAGNLYQFGNTFSDLNGGINLLASRMPVMKVFGEGKNYFEIKLHEGNDLHYLYTIGDGFWNTEQGLDNLKGYRQLIVPKDDITIFDTIQSWQNDVLKSIDFSVAIPESTPSDDIISIQFGTESWFEPVPMISAGNYHWDFSLLTPFPVNNNLKYRLCRNYICDFSVSTPGEIDVNELSPTNNNLIEIKLSDWPSWAPVNYPPTIYAFEIPKKENDYLTGIEFLSDYHPTHINSYLPMLNELMEKGVNTIILHPSLSIEQSNYNPYLNLDPRSDLLTHDIIEINSLAESLDMKLILSPIVRINSEQIINNSHSSFIEYEEFLLIDQYKEMIISYAQLASNFNSKYYIIDLALFDYLSSQENNSENYIDYQPLYELSKIISDVKTLFSGQVMCSIPFFYISTFPSDLFDSCDALYFRADLALSQTAAFEDVKNQIRSIFDDQIFPLYRSTQKPIYIGFSTPSFAPESIDELYPSDGKILSSQNSVSFSGDMDLEYQALIYNAVLNEIIGKDWINGVVASEFYAPLKLTDASSSINGKPAMDVLWYWYTGVK